jgi:hypothetical protein
MLPNRAYFVRRAYKLSAISYKLFSWSYQTEPTKKKYAPIFLHCNFSDQTRFFWSEGRTMDSVEARKWQLKFHWSSLKLHWSSLKLSSLQRSRFHFANFIESSDWSSLLCNVVVFSLIRYFDCFENSWLGFILSNPKDSIFNCHNFC